MIVLDASMVGPLVLPDEQASMSPDTAAALFDAPIMVPAHWRLEVANMLRSAVRRGRITIDGRTNILTRLARLAVEMDQETWSVAWTRTLEISDCHGLTPYDAAYVELAMRGGAPLASLDRDLVGAAQKEGIPLVTLA